MNERLLGLGPDITRRSGPKGFKYFADKKLTDLVIHNDHLSLYIRHLKTLPPDPNGLIVRDATPKYVHAHISRLHDVSALVDLVSAAYTRLG